MGARKDWDDAVAKVRELREAIKQLGEPWPPGDPDEVQCIEHAHEQAESLVDQLDAQLTIGRALVHYVAKESGDADP